MQKLLKHAHHYARQVTKVSLSYHLRFFGRLPRTSGRAVQGSTRQVGFRPRAANAQGQNARGPLDSSRPFPSLPLDYRQRISKSVLLLYRCADIDNVNEK